MQETNFIDPRGEYGFLGWNTQPEYDILDTFSIGDVLSNVRDLRFESTNDDNLKESNGFLIEDEPAGSKAFPSEEKIKNFATTHYMCQKYQLVDLSRARNFSSDGFNLMQKIKIKDHYAARVDCGAEYHIQVCLLDIDLKVLQNF